jgi:hypothetical protein
VIGTGTGPTDGTLDHEASHTHLADMILNHITRNGTTLVKDKIQEIVTKMAIDANLDHGQGIEGHLITIDRTPPLVKGTIILKVLTTIGFAPLHLVEEALNPTGVNGPTVTRQCHGTHLPTMLETASYLTWVPVA